MNFNLKKIKLKQEILLDKRKPIKKSNNEFK